MRRRKAQVSSTLVIMVAGLIGLLVLILVTGGFGKLFSQITGKSSCQMEFLISSFTKTGGMQTTEPNCEPHLITITAKNLSDGRKNAEKTITNQLSQKEKYEKIDSYNQYYSIFSKNQDVYNEWVMDKILADEMKYCWDITGRGKLDLFNDWWMLLDCTSDKGVTYHSCTKDEVYKMYQILGYGIDSDAKAATALGVVGGVLNFAPFKWKAAAVAAVALPPLVDLASGTKKIAKPPTFCVLCSRIKFDKDLPSSLQNKQVSSMGLWLANNPVTDTGAYSKVSYTSYLQNDDYKGIWASNNSYPYDTGQAYAVLYARINVMKSKSLLNDIGVLANVVQDENVPQAIQMIKLVKYKEIQNECQYLVG